MRASLSTAFPAVPILCCLFLVEKPALAQYRSNGLLIEAGGETHDAFPVTAAMFAGSEALHQFTLRYRGLLLDKYAPANATPSCRRLMQQGRVGPPCINNYLGITDGPYVSVGYHRTLGDLLLDISEQPIIRNLWFTWKGTIALAATLPTKGWPMPAFLLLQEWGLRWNILDEKFRPFIALNGIVGTLVEPVGVAARVRDNEKNCAKLRRGEDIGSGVCVDTSNWVPQSPVPLNASTALFTVTSFPPFAGLRPELGVEYFFLEDISAQFHLSAQLLGSPLPEYLLRPPFAGVSLRSGASLVAYF